MQAATQEPLGLGSLLAEIGRKFKLNDKKFTLLQRVRDGNPARAAKVE